MNKKSKILFMLVTAGTVLAGCNNRVQYETFDIVDNAYIPSTYKGKSLYRAYIATPLKSLNTPLTMSAENAQHIANFVDGLLENDSYGRLSKALAEKVFVNFKEEIRASKNILEGDYITIRGKGRFKITKILGTTKSGRLSVEIEK